MSDGFDEVYVDTRRQLRGVAESLIAGPQYRTAGTIRLAVRPGGFAGVAIPLARSERCTPSIPHTMSTHSRRTSPTSLNRADGSRDAALSRLPLIVASALCTAGVGFIFPAFLSVSVALLFSVTLLNFARLTAIRRWERAHGGRIVRVREDTFGPERYFVTAH